MRRLLLVLGWALMAPGVLLALPGALVLVLCGVRPCWTEDDVAEVAAGVANELYRRRCRALESRN